MRAETRPHGKSPFSRQANRPRAIRMLRPPLPRTRRVRFRVSCVECFQMLSASRSRQSYGGSNMSNTIFYGEYRPSLRRALRRDTREQDRHRAALTVDLRESLARERVLLREKSDLSQRQVMLTQEFEHRLINSLQLIVSLLSLQSRNATTPEAATQLTIAARRVGALGRVHRQLHLLDHEDKVQFKPYLQHLCGDLSDLLLQDGSGYAIVVEGENVEIPTAFAIPLGFIVNELITNSAKYAQGNITVRFKATSSGNLSLTVSDNGPGLPTGFDASKCKGLGMKIVLSLVKQIGGELHILPGDNGRGTRFTITFGSRLSPA